jgi:two-component system phosphate regulon sensor histidine kinase PhoR
MGIREEDLKMVFKKYFRVSSGNIHDVKGFGLGLSYVKLMVAAHGGKISLDSKFGEGTQVEIFLPLLDDKAGGV